MKTLSEQLLSKLYESGFEPMQIEGDRPAETSRRKGYHTRGRVKGAQHIKDDEDEGWGARHIGLNTFPDRDDEYFEIYNISNNIKHDVHSLIKGTSWTQFGEVGFEDKKMLARIKHAAEALIAECSRLSGE